MISFSTTIFIILAVLWVAWPKRRSFLPPGPAADPLIGHARIIPTQNQAEVFHEWAQTYGDLIYLRVFSRSMVVIGSFETAQELLEDRSANYSCRPRFIIWEMMGWKHTLSLLQYGQEFLKHRKIFQQYFGRKESLAFNDILAEEAYLLLVNLLHAAPGEHLNYVHRLTVSNITRAAFGNQIKSDDDPFMKLAHDITWSSNNSGPIGNTLPDMFPWLTRLPSWFPGTYYATFALANAKNTRRLYDYSVEYVQRQMRDGNVKRSLVSEKLTDLGDNFNEEDLEDIKGAAATAFTAGEDTSFATLTIFFLVMILHPEYQERAHQEIISAVGKDRLPEYQDRDSLPFVECIFQETLRWHPVVPLCVPHRSLADDMYKGMLIPKGTIMIPNIYGMSRDKNIYSNPEAFDPTRFLSAPEGKGEPHFAAAWGFGRRACPGRHFADLALWHVMLAFLPH
ncbi:cytochrome p450 [Moniliophthora roreri]|uniref:Putative cytochrome P450 n=1 Tax=Moniliophthora roreri TaxID=221103 RepID=A0A0W0EXB2_MONRR|nr:cytochrome p450 [Moniliophthora roreri]